MKRFLWLLILVSMLGLAACSGSPTSTATTAPTAVPATAEPGKTPVPTTVPVALGKLGDPTACNVVGMLPDPNPSLPPVSNSEHVQGNPDARITILEYSDYQ